ncbi:MAG: bifunctional UDP-N-acetylglucosamine diphosphorylase/glucosamine-1-phosphate N-acetyltransferase GlmU [Thermotogae bacterium]|nr:bifunctional UDP-N-acetylglucosamine diphosphorylase/glucosamine-1-phosphate N-acetyltransferase GlmU [Thermotogota bacterium]
MRVLVLAAGLGKRMKSRKPKVLHEILGKPMISWVLDTVRAAGVHEVGVVLGHGAEMVRGILDENVRIFIQSEQLGTAHAVMCAREFVDPDDEIMVLYGDVPLLRYTTLLSLVKVHEEEGNDVTLLSAFLNDPTGYGRVLRDTSGKVQGIVEEVDASPEQRNIREINTGIYVFKGSFLLEALGRIKNDNVQGEYYLTDAVSMASKVGAVVVEDVQEILGVNTRKQLAMVAKIARMRILEALMENGVTVEDPDTTYIGPEVRIGCDTIIKPMTIILGKTTIGENCVIGPFTTMVNCVCGNNVRVVRSECAGAVIEDDASVGPFSRLREGSYVCNGAKVGNYVEMKKARLGRNSKAQHLTYLGDAEVGEDANIGAGTITCNYDGYKKHRTIIEDGAFIGSNVSLVAPVRIGKGAIVGAGSVITEDVSPDALALGRARQIEKPGWAKKYREEREKDGHK